MIGVAIGLGYANAAEWVIHRHILHGLGKKKESFWSFHWGEHHRSCRRDGNRDAAYEASPFEWNAQGKELTVLSAAAIAHLPLLGVAPLFTLTVMGSALRYYVVHRRAHLDPEWGREHLPWHYDHHMGKNQDANWCVTHPFFDHVMGTRVVYTYEGPRARPLPI